MSTGNTIVERLNLLGLKCDEAPGDRLTSAVTALSCYPMYMVANVHAWTKEKQWSIPLTDIPGFEAIREAFAIGRQEKKLEITPEHRHVLGTMLKTAKPSDRVIYEYAMETLVMFFSQADAAVVENMRNAIAKMIVAVAEASGDGLLGSGERVNRFEYSVIQHIAGVLKLREAPDAKATLDSIEA